MVAPSGEGGQRCMKMAMAMADEIGGKKNVDYVNTHGTSTPVRGTRWLRGAPTLPHRLPQPSTAFLHLSLPRSAPTHRAAPS